MSPEKELDLSATARRYYAEVTHSHVHRQHCRVSLCTVWLGRAKGGDGAGLYQQITDLNNGISLLIESRALSWG